MGQSFLLTLRGQDTFGSGKKLHCSIYIVVLKLALVAGAALAVIVPLVLVMAPHLFTLPNQTGSSERGKWGRKWEKAVGQHSNDNRFANAKSVNTNQICITQLAWPGLVVVAEMVGLVGPWPVLQVESTESFPFATLVSQKSFHHSPLLLACFFFRLCATGKAFSHVLLAGNAQTLVNLMVPAMKQHFRLGPANRKQKN